VIIDGGGRMIDLTGVPLITVGTSVTLTLRNITFMGLGFDFGDTVDNNAPPSRWKIDVRG
jgi:hypothetical protein